MYMYILLPSFPAGSFDLPALDGYEDSEEIVAASFSRPQSAAPNSSSPFIESQAMAYSSHMASVMGGRVEMEFQELLPAGSTKKTASQALSHVLGKHTVTS